MRYPATFDLQKLWLVSLIPTDWANKNQLLCVAFEKYTIRFQSTHLGIIAEKSEKAPEEWKQYLQQGIAQLGASLGAVSSNEHPVKGQPDFFEGDELIQFWKQTWGEFAVALEAWSAIRMAATELLESQTKN